MKKCLLIVLLFMTVTISSVFAQSGWQSGNYYQHQGSTFTESCSYPYSKQDPYGRYLGMHQCMRTTVWHQQWYKGYIYLWNAYTGKWYTEWREGIFWYYTWNTYEVFVRW